MYQKSFIITTNGNVCKSLLIKESNGHGLHSQSMLQRDINTTSTDNQKLEAFAKGY